MVMHSWGSSYVVKYDWLDVGGDLNIIWSCGGNLLSWQFVK